MNQIEISNSISRTLPPLPSRDMGLEKVKVDEQALQTPTPVRVEKQQQTPGEAEAAGNGKAYANSSVNSNEDMFSPEELQQEIEKANEVLKETNAKHLSFFVDDATGKQGVRVIDTQTNEVIRQFPPEEALNIAARIREHLGALVDQVA